MDRASRILGDYHPPCVRILAQSQMIDIIVVAGLEGDFPHLSGLRNDQTGKTLMQTSTQPYLPGTATASTISRYSRT